MQMNQPLHEIAAYSVQQFCDAHSLGKATFYALLKKGSGPRLMKIGRRTLISREAAVEWRQRMETETGQ